MSKLTPAKMRRILFLLEAQKDIDALERAAKNNRVDPAGGDYRAMAIEVGDYCIDGGSPDAGIEIDLPVARKLIPILRDLIGDELAALGYEA